MAAALRAVKSPTRAARDKAARVGEWVENLTEQQLACRTRGHGSNMRPLRVGRHKAVGQPSVYYRVVLRCKCRVQRVMFMSRTGAIISGHYDYTDAPGYPAPEGMGRLVGSERDIVRLEGVLRFLRTHELEEDE